MLECYNLCGRLAVGSYYIGNERVQLCSPCMAEQDERDEMQAASEAEDA
jgi:hypothetical protein